MSALEPGIQKILDAMNALEGPPAHEVPVEQARAGHEQETAELAGPGEEVGEVKDVEVPGAGGPIPLRVYKPLEPKGGAVAYFHGGGWVVGSIDSFDTACRALANASGAIVASVGYRLAPEHPFPAALEDCVAATRGLASSTRASRSPSPATARAATSRSASRGGCATGSRRWRSSTRSATPASTRRP